MSSKLIRRGNKLLTNRLGKAFKISDSVVVPSTGTEDYITTIAEANSFISNKTGSWYEFEASSSGLSTGMVDEAGMRTLLNASDSFVGLSSASSTRHYFESQVSEMSNIPGLLQYYDSGANSANFYERISIPKSKDVDYVDATEVCAEIDFFFLDGTTKTGTVSTDRRTYRPDPHTKRNGLTTSVNQPGPGDNPGSDGNGFEAVLMSQYAPDTFNNNFPFGNKGDEFAYELGVANTTFDLSGTYESFSTSSDEYTKRRMILAIGLYATDIDSDYEYQVQTFPCYPGTNIRMTFEPDTLYKMKYVIGMNTVTDGVSNGDGYLRWFIQSPGINNGDWFLASYLNNKNWTGNVEMQLRNLPLGIYYGGSGSGEYLDNGNTANGIWYSKFATHYK